MPKDAPAPAPAKREPVTTSSRGAPRLGALDLEAHLRDASRKQAFVTPMFDTIAPRYDRFTRLFSFGMDARWKRLAVADAVQAVRAQGLSRPRVLDLASGTGDLAVALARALPDATVTALDASRRMTEAAAGRLAKGAADADVGPRVRVLVGDMDRLALPDASVDVVTAGYGVRNTPDARRAVREMARVLRPGGVVVTLDFYRPQFAPWRRLLLAYLAGAGNLVGWWWHREPVVYGYIARSIDHFMSWQAFSRLLRDEGMAPVAVRRFLGGGIAIHVARSG